MKLFNRYGYAPLFTAAVVAAAVGALWLSGCSKKPAQEPPVFGSEAEAENIPETPPDTSSFTDDRDAAAYKTAKIGGKTWMAENLRYQAKDSWCYDDDSANCGKYGRLYVWNAAKTVCPTGWRLPTRQEWISLAEAAGGEEAAGKRLKAKTGWDEDGNGTDRHGFSALPGGNRHHTAGDFSYAGGIGFWWTSTAYDGGGNAYSRAMNYSDDDVSESYSAVGGGLSVRCLKDD